MDVKRKIEASRARALMDYPFFGTILCPLPLKESKDITTLATDGKSIFYNEEYLEDLEPDVVMGCLLHEVLHPAFFHISRRGSRDHKLWNIACDYAINPILINEGVRLPEGALYEEKYNGWEADKIYEDLIEQGIDAGDFVLLGEESFDIGGTGMFEDSSTSTSERNEMENEWKSRLVGAAEAVKFRGSVPSDLKSLIDSFLSPSVLWSDKLKEYAKDAVRKKYSFLRPMKKYIDQDIYLGSSIKKKGIRTMVAAMDSSGSAYHMAPQYGAELTEIMTECDVDEMHVLWIDTKVHKVQTFTKESLPIVLEVEGCGGTAFEPAFDWVEEHNIDPSLLIYFTDMMGSFPSYEPNYPVIWVAYDSRKEYYEKDCTFGDVVEVNL
jgi:predicted metal-dependent peptidase|tara:strand:+ start:551 stop:1693 length:1143 start_codon:yes stop_codon:yes gene_type:complete